MKSTHKILTGFLALALALSAGYATAQAYPSKPIKLVVGFAPGGGNDSLARIIGQKLSEQLGQPVIIENKTGADGRIAAEYVARSAPDGYTLMSGSSGQMVYNSGLFANMQYDPIKSFTPITLLGFTQLLFVSNNSLPAHNIGELIALAKAKPGTLFYGSASSPHYVAFELFQKTAGINITNIRYKGDVPAVTAAMAGDVAIASTSVAGGIALVQAHKLRALAVTGAQRSKFMPDVPTVKESGINFEGVSWTGMYAPAATPRPIVDKLYGALSVVLKDPALRNRIETLGYETSMTGMPQAEFAVYHKAEFDKWMKVMKDLNIRPE